MCAGTWACGLAPREDAPPKPAAVPFELLPTRHIAINITINGKGPYRVIFDTGSPLSLISSKVAKAAGLAAKNTSFFGLSLLGSIEPVKVRSLKLGALAAENVPFLVMDHPTVEAMASVFGPIEGILGFPFFARYRMTLDYQSKQMTFVPNGFEPTDILQALTNGLLTQNKVEPRLLAPQACGDSAWKRTGKTVLRALFCRKCWRAAPPPKPVCKSATAS